MEKTSRLSIEQLQPADKREVGVYFPYYQGNRRTLLPYAISLYKRGNLEGERTIEGGESIPFLATWYVSSLPADLTRCRLQFDGNAELSYEVMMANFEFVNYLIDVVIQIKRGQVVDFAQGFYKKLMRYDD
jgi:hypothetical protein